MYQLPEPWIAHFRGGCSFRIGSASRHGRPAVARALAAQPLPGGRLEVLVPLDVGAEVLAAVSETGHVSLVASVPTSHRTLHVKGHDARVSTPVPAHEALLASCRDRLVDQVVPFGFTRDMIVGAWFDLTLADLACVQFTVHGAWDQTPGPGAGQPVALQR